MDARIAILALANATCSKNDEMNFSEVGGHYLPSVVTQNNHWRRQIWSTGARAPSAPNNKFFSAH